MRRCILASRQSNVGDTKLDEVKIISSELQGVLDRIDRIGLTQAGAMLARVLDTLSNEVNATGNTRAI